ncbi:MAG: DUF2017 domain-containing protein [Streptosporangiaceae bacterium]
MEPFRSVRGGGARAWLAAAEASLLRNLVGQIMTLVEPESPPGPAGGSGPDGSGPPDDLAEFEAMLHPPGAVQAPDDPVLARLLPDAYSDDPEAAGEFRKYTEPALRGAKYEVARQMLATLPEAGGRIQLTGEQALAWLKALNDVRLALGVRLGVTEEFEEQWGALKPDDPQWAAYEVYAWLGAVQESLVQALA